MPTDQWVLSATRTKLRGDIKDLIDTVVGELGLPEEWEDRIFTAVLVLRVYRFINENIEEGFGGEIPADAIQIGIEAIKFQAVLERWLQGGFSFGPFGGLMMFSARQQLDP